MKINSPIKTLLARRLLERREELKQWCQRLEADTPPPFYCSIDLRDSGYKIAPVDSNLYPAGFNNVCPEDQRTAPPIIKAQFEAEARRAGRPTPKKILILPESHTSNRFYIENLYYLSSLVRNAGFEVEIGWYGPAPETLRDGFVPLTSETDKELRAYPIEIKDGVLKAGAFVPDWVLLNNDFSAGYPGDLDQIRQPVTPTHALGWHTRRKGRHFVHYNKLAAEMALLLEIDPWFLKIDTQVVEPVNFNEGLGIEETAQVVQEMLAQLHTEYSTRGITRPPFVYVKNNAGTYGMGIMVAHSAHEIREMNRRTKNKMSVGKGRSAIGSVVVQEGIPTATIIDRLAAEPAIYLVGGELIGGFLRANTERNEEENLNSQGMAFRKLCMSDLRELFETDNDAMTDELPVLEMVYGAVARISSIAAGMELKERASKTPAAG